MRTRVFIDGVYGWSANVPSTPGTFTLRGSLSFSGPGSVELARIATQRRQGVADMARRIEEGRAPAPHPNTVYATDEERLEARRRTFRESKKRQAERRAQLRAEVAAIRKGRAA